MVARKDSFRWPESISAACWTGLGVETYGSWLPVLGEKTGMRTRLTPTFDTVCRFRWLRFGLVDMTAGGTTETSQMLEGDRRYSKRDSGPFQLRAFWAQSKTNSGYMVRGDSHIKTIDDIRPGIRVVDMRSYLANQRILEGFLVWGGHIKDVEKEVVWVPANSTEHKAQLVIEGKADLAFVLPTSQTTYEAEKNPHSIRWVEVNAEKEPNGARRFMEIDPLVSFAPMFYGTPSCIGKWGTVGISLFCTRVTTDPEFVYHLARWLDENWGLVKDNHPWNNYMTRNSLMEEIPHTFFPLHDGLIEYLKDLGLWTGAMERRNRNNIDLVTRYCEANQKAIEIADDKRIWVSSKNPEWVEFWESYKKELGLPRFKVFLSLEDD